ncbi:MAG: hypothetical protein RMJ83_09455 [Armatimonadota bacterium]|nr:hypothetical protein [Armatimonadota bacterium]
MRELWFLRTDLPASGVLVAWSGLLGWTEQRFRQLQRWRLWVGLDAGVCEWLVCASGQWVMGVGVRGWVRWWDGVCGGGLVGVVGVLGGALAWDVGGILGLGEGGELK